MTDHRVQNRQLWNEWSDDFQAIWNSQTAEGELPPTPSPFGPDAHGYAEQTVLDSVDGKAYAELGCGGGQASVGTALLGAEPVVGVDLSGEQLTHARHLRDFSGVDAQFVQGDVTNLPLPSNRFDLASSEAAFQMVPDLSAALGEARRILRDGGVFVLSVPHTYHEIIDEETATVEESYFADGPRTITIDEGYDADMVTFDRTVAELYNALVDAGFEIDRMVEHQRYAVEHNDLDETDSPDVLWKLPQSLRFWAVAR